MSRAHAIAPSVGAEASFRGHLPHVTPSGPRPVRRVRPVTSFYLERAMLLWPRLDRARLRKVVDDPARIAEIVERRTSQPYAVILAMLTRQSSALADPAAEPKSPQIGRPDPVRLGLRIVRSEDGDAIEVQDLQPA
jgi:hypothetical protein